MSDPIKLGNNRFCLPAKNDGAILVTDRFLCEENGKLIIKKETKGKGDKQKTLYSFLENENGEKFLCTNSGKLIHTLQNKRTKGTPPDAKTYQYFTRHKDVSPFGACTKDGTMMKYGGTIITVENPKAVRNPLPKVPAPIASQADPHAHAAYDATPFLREAPPAAAPVRPTSAAPKDKTAERFQAAFEGSMIDKKLESNLRKAALTLKLTNESLEERIKALEEQLKNLRQTTAGKDVKIKALEKDLEESRLEGTKDKTRADALEDELADLRKKKITDPQKQADEIRRLTEELKIANEAKLKAENDLALESEKARLEKEKDQAELEAEKERARAKEQNDADEIARLKAELAAALEAKTAAELKTLEAEKKAKQEEALRLQAEAAAAQAKRELEAEQERARLAAEQAAEIARLQAQLAEQALELENERQARLKAAENAKLDLVAGKLAENALFESLGELSKKEREAKILEVEKRNIDLEALLEAEKKKTEELRKQLEDALKIIPQQVLTADAQNQTEKEEEKKPEQNSIGTGDDLMTPDTDPDELVKLRDKLQQEQLIIIQQTELIKSEHDKLLAQLKLKDDEIAQLKAQLEDKQNAEKIKKLEEQKATLESEKLLLETEHAELCKKFDATQIDLEALIALLDRMARDAERRAREQEKKGKGVDAATQAPEITPQASDASLAQAKAEAELKLAQRKPVVAATPEVTAKADGAKLSSLDRLHGFVKEATYNHNTALLKRTRRGADFIHINPITALVSIFETQQGIRNLDQLQPDQFFKRMEYGTLPTFMAAFTPKTREKDLTLEAKTTDQESRKAAFENFKEICKDPAVVKEMCVNRGKNLQGIVKETVAEILQNPNGSIKEASGVSLSSVGKSHSNSNARRGG